jgi:HAD superfamily hydrolase (TIGR01509 family)
MVLFRLSKVQLRRFKFPFSSTARILPKNNMGRDELVVTVIFDVDGTLAETEEFHRLAFNRAFADFGLAWVWDVPLYRDLLKVTGGKERILHYAARHPGLAADYARAVVADLHRRKTEIYTDMVVAGEVILRPGVGEFLDRAVSCGMELGIATTTSAPNVEALLRVALGADWRRIFPVVAAGDMVQRKKPAPDIYMLAMERWMRGPAQCVAVEDSRNGVRSARAAGLRVIGVRSQYCSDDDLSDASLQLPDCTGLSLELLDRLEAAPA